MNFQQILCFLFNRLQKEKTANAAYYIIQGKRSGQSLQDARNYGLEPFFSILPKLTMTQFEQEVDYLRREQLMTIDEDNIVHMTAKGEQLIVPIKQHHFNGWYYRGNERIFFNRLALIVQTASYMRVGEKRFLPIQHDPKIQLFVKQFLRGKLYTTPAFAAQLKEELHRLLQDQVENEIGKEVFVYRLTGYQYTGWTWLQIAKQLQMNPLDAQCALIETLHYLLQQIEQSNSVPLLTEIAKDIKLTITLTTSAKQTKQLFDVGKSIEEIAIIRQLKMSTIEDHMIEIAMNDPDFPLHLFVSNEEQMAVRQFIAETKTKKLRPLKEQFSKLTYFQLRLILSTPKG